MSSESESFQFPGFSEKAFLILDRLKTNPWFDQYRIEKEAISVEIMEPFKVLRDDIVVNWVIPNGYDLETERNVFSRLLKNDFGKGGCNHHLWFSFYRPGFRRLTDLQLAFSLFPGGLNIGIYLAERAEQSMARVHDLMSLSQAEFLITINKLLTSDGFVAVLKRKGETFKFEQTIDRLDEIWFEAEEIWIKTRISRERITRLGPDIMPEIVSSTLALDQLYKYCLAKE